MGKSYDEAAKARIAQATPQIQNSLKMIREGRPLRAETNDTRAERRMVAKGTMSGPEAVWGTRDFVNVGFLAKGARVARAVARVAFDNGDGWGSGFLIGEDLFITNNHVIGSPGEAASLRIEFDYERDLNGALQPTTRFKIDATVFVTSPQDALDYTIVAVGAKVDGPEALATFGCIGLSDALDKHMLGEFANIVQHPKGRLKEVVLRENQLVGRYDGALHYVADTEPGSSGSPVFNGEWQAIAVHHWGGPHIQIVGEDGKPLKKEINEGIRISAILDDLKKQLPGLDAATSARINKILAAGEGIGPRDPLSPTRAPAPPQADSCLRIEPDGRLTWSGPIEFSIRLGAAAAALQSAASVSQPAVAANAPAAPPMSSTTTSENAPQKDYSNRKGYRRAFIEGHVVELPKLTDAQRKIAAKNRQAAPGDDPVVLPYHHFSVVLNSERKLAFFTASNIDGKTAKKVNRQTKKVSPLTVDDLKERMELAEAAEASESWYDDPRVDRENYADGLVYSGQTVPGFPKPADRLKRMFQRGHLVRRLDPCWGDDDTLVLAAEADTFHWTNCSPQVGFFNMGSAGSSHAGGGKLWRALEDYVLRGAVDMDTRVNCFTGPIFEDGDRKFRSIKVPGRFFKVLVWAEGKTLRSVAMIADQRPVITAWPESLGEARTPADFAEAFGDPGELKLVEDFLTTVKAVEALTKLDFGDNVRKADIRAGQADAKVDDASAITLTPKPAAPRRAARRRPRRAAPQA